ncbi:MAG: hypothetical protein QE271_01230 [Bacteriovoracaceae bacterium]|nr:hypothetical protein [Bacteriovoracaceae bacterium]
MKKMITLALCIFIENCIADCKDLYTRKINEISGRMNPARTTVIVNAGAEVAVVTTLAAAGVLSVGAVVALPAAALAAGTYLTTLAIKKKSYTKSLLAIKQAEEGSGPVFDKLAKEVMRKNHFNDKEEVRKTLIQLNSENVFCRENPRNGKVKITKFKSMIRIVAAEVE